jgi:hypothetical protein
MGGGLHRLPFRIACVRSMMSAIGGLPFAAGPTFQSTVSRSGLAVTDRHSTALAATFGVVRNTRELLMDPDWTQIVAATNWQFLVWVDGLAACFQALLEGFEHRRTLNGRRFVARLQQNGTGYL